MIYTRYVPVINRRRNLGGVCQHRLVLWLMHESIVSTDSTVQSSHHLFGRSAAACEPMLPCSADGDPSMIHRGDYGNGRGAKRPISVTRSHRISHRHAHRPQLAADRGSMLARTHMHADGCDAAQRQLHAMHARKRHHSSANRTII